MSCYFIKQVVTWQYTPSCMMRQWFVFPAARGLSILPIADWLTGHSPSEMHNMLAPYELIPWTRNYKTSTCERLLWNCVPSLMPSCWLRANNCVPQWEKNIATCLMSLYSLESCTLYKLSSGHVQSSVVSLKELKTSERLESLRRYSCQLVEPRRDMYW